VIRLCGEVEYVEYAGGLVEVLEHLSQQMVS
jgi:hypothetical protein